MRREKEKISPKISPWSVVRGQLFVNGEQLYKIQSLTTGYGQPTNFSFLLLPSTYDNVRPAMRGGILAPGSFQQEASGCSAELF
jgi:hypothetical protein